jgi:hypothetical protein
MSWDNRSRKIRQWHLKDGEEENIRIRLEICNENGGRSVIPFTGMLPGDDGASTVMMISYCSALKK